MASRVDRSWTGLDVQWREIAPAARIVWASASAAPVALLSVVLAVVAFALGAAVPALVLLALGAVIAAALWALAGRRWRAWGYAERDVDLVIRRGVVVRRLTIVPYGRMQFVDVTQGPLARRLGLATLKLHTAAAATDAEIPLLPEHEASRLRDRLAERGEANAAGV